MGGKMDTNDPWDENDGEELEAEIMRADHPFGVGLRGTTAEEALEGESIDEELVQERPENAPVEEAFEVVAEEVPDIEDELVGEGSLVEDEFASPEESAVSVRDDAPGSTDHEDPHRPDADPAPDVSLGE
jgi:hypothetical protein